MSSIPIPARREAKMLAWVATPGMRRRISSSSSPNEKRGPPIDGGSVRGNFHSQTWEERAGGQENARESVVFRGSGHI